MKKPRKPKPLIRWSGRYIAVAGIEQARYGGLVYLTTSFVHEVPYMDAKECREVGAWLLKAADYLDAKKGQRRER